MLVLPRSGKKILCTSLFQKLEIFIDTLILKRMRRSHIYLSSIHKKKKGFYLFDKFAICVFLQIAQNTNGYLLKL